MTLTAETLDLLSDQFPTIPKHLIKLIHEFDEKNPTYLQDNPEKFQEAFQPEAFTKVMEDSVSIRKVEDLPPTKLAEGLPDNVISGLTDDEYEKQIEEMKRKEIEDEKKKQ